MTAPLELRLAHLYPDLMNIYGDRGNVMALRWRCERRGIAFRVVPLDLGEPFDPGACDLALIGGAQDSEQRRVADDLREVKGDALRRAIEDGLPVLAVCGGYQLLQRFYRAASGEELAGLGVFDAWTVHPGPRARRLIGNVVARWAGGTLVGFENHGGRTELGPGAQPLATVVRGHGNNGRDRTEGAVYRNAFGTYLHGALLPKNPAFADHLLRLALSRRYGDVTLAPLDDLAELRAHEAALRLR
ncbi:MAG TPA: glutamine amidotransferase [Dehalococcoidia bacterium]|nr:glutamine amidotransferase [Dehalococcoidia bacterium]